MSKKTPKYDMNNYDNEGNLIPAFPVSEETQKDKFKTSVGYSLIAVLLYIFAMVPVIVIPLVIALKCYDLLPYYGLWDFIGVVLAGVFMLVFFLVAIVVSRPHSKHSIRNQTSKIAITYTVCTCLVAVLMTYVFPDVIVNATQGTMKTEDLYYLGSDQVETNAALERDYIMYNILVGNVNSYDENGKIKAHGDYSYQTLSKRTENSSHVFLKYNNDEINETYNDYMSIYASVDEFKTYVIDPLEKNYPRQFELYDFIYNNYVLTDYDYAFYNNLERRAFAMSVTDYILKYSNYEKYLKEGFVLEGSNPKMHEIFVNNYDSFNQDGYVTFDDELLLIAQMTGRMTIPAVVRLVLNEGWSYTQPSYGDSAGATVQYSEEGNFLYEIYDLDMVTEYASNGGTFTDGTDELMNEDGTTYTVAYGYNDDGWKMYENGIIHRPMSWLVLDMLGDPMPLASLDLGETIDGLLPGMGSTVMGVVRSLLKNMPGLIDSLGSLVKDGLGETLEVILGGASLSISLCVDDTGNLAINLLPMNVEKAMLGYMQATWVSMDYLLMAVVDVISLRNWLAICGGIGLILVIAAGVVRDAGRKTRERSSIARDKILRDRAAAETAATGQVGEVEVTEDELPDLGIKKKKRSKKDKSKPAKEDIWEENENYEYDYSADYGDYEDYDINPKKKKKKKDQE